jgi:hypothetical protein
VITQLAGQWSLTSFSWAGEPSTLLTSVAGEGLQTDRKGVIGWLIDLPRGIA